MTRFKWVVLGFVVVGTAAGVLATRFLKPTYVARATIWVELPERRGRDVGVLAPGQLLGASAWVDLVRSQVVLGAVARELQLYLEPLSPGATALLAEFGVTDDVRPGRYRLVAAPAGGSFTLFGADDAQLQRGSVGDSVGAELGFRWAPDAAALPPGTSVEFAVTAPSDAAQRLATKIKVQPNLDGNFIRLELRGSRPTRVVAILNAVAERFVAVAADLKRRKLIELASILGDQVRHAETNLREAEATLRDFEVRTAPVLGGAAGAAPRRPAVEVQFGSLVELKVGVDQLRRDREAIERALAQAGDAGVLIDALEIVPAVHRSSELTQALEELTRKRAELRALGSRYTEAHAPVRRLLEEVQALERRTIPTLARRLAVELGERERGLEQGAAAASAQLRQIPPLAIEEARHRRAVAIAEQVFSSIRQRYEEARLTEVSSLPDARILDRATEPQRPVSDTGPVVILLAVLLSLGVGAAGAVVLDRLDATVRSPDQVIEHFGLRILGALPHLQRDGDTAPQVIDALRGIRLSVIHAYGLAGPLVVTVSSPCSADGKSFVTSNLALAFADAGFRTLLVDGDLRRGGLHRVLGVRRKPGLTDVLAGEAPTDLALQETAHAGLTFFGCGSRTRTGPELLSSAAMTQLLVALRARYGVILIDSPPLAAGVEPYVLGTLTGNLLLVVRLGMTDRELAEAKLDALDRLPIRVLGAVLNDVRSSEAYRRYAYGLAGYELYDEESSWAESKILRERS